MKFIVSQTKGVSSDLVKRVKGVLCQQARRKIGGDKSAVSALVQKAQNGAQDAVKGALNRGFSGVGSGGSKSIVYAGPFGRRGFTTVPWKALSQRYARSSPVSTVFWKKHSESPYKHGAGSRTALHALFASATMNVPRPTTTGVVITERGSGKRKLCTLSWDIKVVSPSNVLEDAIMVPLLQGASRRPLSAASNWSPHEPSTNHVSMLVWVEGRRPFIRQMSYDIGLSLNRHIRERFGQLR